MSSLFENQENNWAYILLLVAITAIAAFGISTYARDTIKEIDTLSVRSVIVEQARP